jgi:signal transduction histidine kinase
MNILVVDDNVTNRKLLCVTLEAEGLRVVEAANGVEAMAALESDNINGIISDILMPRMDGYRLCYEVRASKRFCHLPFIVYTNTYTSPKDETTGLDLGADKFLRKPAQAREIVAAFRTLLEKPRPERPRRIAPPHGLELMKEYSEALVKKLEEKNLDLQLVAEQLTQMNQLLTVKTRELERAREALREDNEKLEKRVRERTGQLEAANKELDAFSHSVAHDLRAPLRAIDGFCHALEEDSGDGLSVEGRKHLARIAENAQRMNQFIEGLLSLAHAGFLEIVSRPVKLSQLANEIADDLRRSQPEREVEFLIASDIMVRGDKVLLRVMLENLLGNAWKFTGKKKRARIEFGTERQGDLPTFFVRDNGAGFDMDCVGKLFHAFGRLHLPSEFPGTGVGLATVQRIIRRHGGLIWAEGATGRGATFYFMLGDGVGKTDE